MSNQPITHIVRSYDARGQRRYTSHEGIEAAIAERQYRRDNLCDFQIEIVEVQPVEIPVRSGPVIGYRPLGEQRPAKRPAGQRERVR